VTFRSGPIVTDEPVGGWLELTIDSKGQWFFAGHLHNSAALKQYSFAVAAALNAPDSAGRIAYTEFKGHLQGGPDDANWGHGGTHGFVRSDWDRARAAGFTWSYNLEGDLVATLRDIRDNLGWGLAVAAMILLAPSGDDKRTLRCRDQLGQTVTIIIYDKSQPPPQCPPGSDPAP
jgi:hypothetical protein